MSAIAEREPEGREVQHGQNDPNQFASVIERIAMDPSVPLDRLERILDMKERMEDRAREDAEREAKKVYFADMSKCQAELPVVVKNKKNDHTKSNYADLAAIEQQAMPIIHQHGFAVSFQPAGYNEKGELQIKWTISHEGGHAQSDIAGVPVDGAGSQGKVNKTGTQAFGSTATYGRRYLLCMLFNISTGDDRDGNAPAVPDEPVETISTEQRDQIIALIAEAETTADKWCRVAKIEAIPDLPAKDFDRAVTGLRQRIANLKSQSSAATSAKAALDKQFGENNG